MSASSNEFPLDKIPLETKVYVTNPYHAFSSSVFSSPSKQIYVEEQTFRSSQSFQSSGSSAACVECRTPTVSATDTLTRFTRPVPLDKCV